MTNQLAIPDEDRDALPPFRSSKDFPLRPKADQLQGLYQDCHQALMDANEARRILRKRMSEKKAFIAKIRLEIERLENTLAPEGNSRIRLHMMNVKLLDALKEMEEIADGITRVAYEGNRAPRTSLRHFIEQLKAFARRWRAFKLQLQQELLELEGGGKTARDELNG
jgi:hypothetical protein